MTRAQLDSIRPPKRIGGPSGASESRLSPAARKLYGPMEEFETAKLQSFKFLLTGNSTDVRHGVSNQCMREEAGDWEAGRGFKEANDAIVIQDDDVYSCRETDAS
eukprot:767803-Hanusia_phi.AAC.3